MKRILLPLIITMFCFMNVSAQDTLFKRNGQIIVAKVVEVSPDLVKYTFPDKKDSLVIGMDRDDLKKIVFASGMVQWIVPELTSPENYTDQKKKDLKFDFLSPILNHLTLTYEKSVKPGLSWESSMTWVGPGFSKDLEKAGGIIIGAGVKFIKTPDYYQRGMRYSHILKGSYLRLQGYLGYYEESWGNNTPWIYNSNIVNQYTVFAIHTQFGRQWVVNDSFLFDIFAGLGYGIVSHTSNSPYNYDSNNDLGYHYTFVGIGLGPLSISGGLRIGFLF